MSAIETIIQDASEVYELGDHACNIIKGSKSALKILNPLLPSYHLRKGMGYQKATFGRLQDTVGFMNERDHSKLHVKYDELQTECDGLLDKGNVMKWSRDKLMECRQWKQDARELNDGTERLSKKAESEHLWKRKKKARQSSTEESSTSTDTSKQDCQGSPVVGDDPFEDSGTSTSFVDITPSDETVSEDVTDAS